MRSASTPTTPTSLTVFESPSCPPQPASARPSSDSVYETETDTLESLIHSSDRQRQAAAAVEEAGLEVQQHSGEDRSWVLIAIGAVTGAVTTMLLGALLIWVTGGASRLGMAVGAAVASAAGGPGGLNSSHAANSSTTESAFGLASALPQRACYDGLYADGEWVHDSSQWYPYLTGTPFTRKCDVGSRKELNIIWHRNQSAMATAPLPIGDALLNSSQAYVRPALQWRWAPTHCALHQFPFHSPVDFCLALNNRSLMIVGDSISYQHYQALIYALGERMAGENWKSLPDNMLCRFWLDSHYRQQQASLCAEQVAAGTDANLTSAACGAEAMVPPSTVTIRYRRNDHASLVTAESASRLPQRSDVEYPWHESLGVDDILVLNAGVHVVAAEVYAEQLRAALAWLNINRPDVTVIFRTSVPGHYDCNSPRMSVPFSRAQFDQLALMDLLPFAGPPSWGWQLVPHLNDVARSVLQEMRQPTQPAAAAAVNSSSLHPWDELSRCLRLTPGQCAIGRGGYLLLDAFESAKLRPDAHVPGDCLHQCLPGPIDHWNTLLFNLITRSAS